MTIYEFDMRNISKKILDNIFNEMKLLNIALIALAMSACSCRAPAPLTMDELKNTDYQSGYSVDGMITLTNGFCIETLVPDSASRLRVTLSDMYAHGDLNGDGVSDAAVILISNSGGSGTFYDLGVVVNQNGIPQHAASAFLGDRINVCSVTIISGEIKVEMIIQGPTDPMSRTSRMVSQTYTLHGDRLVRTEEIEIQPDTE